MPEDSNVFFRGNLIMPADPVEQPRPLAYHMHRMIIDCHVHTSACTPGHGSMSERLLHSVSMRFARWRLGLGLSSSADAQVECALADRLAETVKGTREIDAAVVLAF